MLHRGDFYNKVTGVALVNLFRIDTQCLLSNIYTWCDGVIEEPSTDLRGEAVDESRKGSAID